MGHTLQLRLARLTHTPRAARFCETLRAAKQGDANMMELLSQMLSEGYGCQADAEKARCRTMSSYDIQHSISIVAMRCADACSCAASQAKFWHLMAREHGARRLEGVYDELP